MSAQSIDRYDELRGYCRVLGHHLLFGYCRCVGEGLPCSRILDCWFERIDVESFVLGHYSAAQRERIFAPPKPKIISLVEMIENARRNAGEE